MQMVAGNFLSCRSLNFSYFCISVDWPLIRLHDIWLYSLLFIYLLLPIFLNIVDINKIQKRRYVY